MTNPPYTRFDNSSQHIERASMVYLTLPVDPYWQFEGEQLDQEAPYPGLDDVGVQYPDPAFARIRKAEARALVRDYPCSGPTTVVGNTLKPNFFTRGAGRRLLFILRLHAEVDLDSNSRGPHERPVTLEDVEAADRVYVRLRMVEQYPSKLERKIVGSARRLRLNLRSRQTRIKKTEAKRLVREPRGGTDVEWRIVGRTGAGKDGREVHIDRLGGVE